MNLSNQIVRHCNILWAMTTLHLPICLTLVENFAKFRDTQRSHILCKKCILLNSPHFLRLFTSLSRLVLYSCFDMRGVTSSAPIISGCVSWQGWPSKTRRAWWNNLTWQLQLPCFSLLMAPRIIHGEILTYMYIKKAYCCVCKDNVINAWGLRS